jgi:dTDP-D-glucose 4,6-dehydratase
MKNSGGWVTRHLAHMYQKSYNIACLDKIDTVASESNIASLCSLPNFQFVQGDITNMRDLTGALETYNIDCVMHFAASSHVQNSFSDPFSFTHNNVIGTHMLLEAMRSYGKIKRFVHVSTDEVYGETNGVFATETHRLGPTNPYSASKAAAEMYVNAYWKSFKIPTIIVRSNNVYRPCQYPESKPYLNPCLYRLYISWESSNYLYVITCRAVADTPQKSSQFSRRSPYLASV